MMIALLICILLLPVLLASPSPESDVNTLEILKAMKDKITKLEAADNELRAKIEEMDKHQSKRELSAEYADSLFLATISTSTLSISDEEPIIWDSAPINPGGHFNTVLGAYTAPYSGYYQFSVTKRGDDERAHFWLLLDEVRYLYYDLYAQGLPSGSITINVQLTAGQVVRVENRYNPIIYGTDSAGSIQSWFTGHLLYAL